MRLCVRNVKETQFMSCMEGCRGVFFGVLWTKFVAISCNNALILGRQSDHMIHYNLFLYSFLRRQGCWFICVLQDVFLLVWFECVGFRCTIALILMAWVLCLIQLDLFGMVLRQDVKVRNLQGRFLLVRFCGQHVLGSEVNMNPIWWPECAYDSSAFIFCLVLQARIQRRWVHECHGGLRASFLLPMFCGYNVKAQEQHWIHFWWPGCPQDSSDCCFVLALLASR